MSKIITLESAKDVNLSKMAESDVRKLVIGQADALLKSLPKEIQISNVNAVQVVSNPREINGDGAWAQWTRACCDKRSQIANFVYPTDTVLGEGFTAEMGEKLGQDHFDSNFAVRAVASALK